MLALAIAAVGIGFILGVLFSDIVIAKPLRQSLLKIKQFGYKNSGYGYSCARLAEQALSKDK
jgi:hypothetical protein